MTEAVEPALTARFRRGLDTCSAGVALQVGRRSVGYEELNEMALRLAGALLATDEPPRVVGVLTGQSVTAYAGILGVLYAGCTVVPLHVDFPTARTRYMLEVAGVTAVIADERGLAELAELSAAGLDLPVLAPGLDLDHTGLTGIAEGAPMLAAPRPARDSDTAYVLFTSGSTGQPKGVPITHGMTRHYFDLADRRYDFTADDVFSQTFDLNFDCAMFDMFCAWGAGAAVHPVPAPAYLDLPAFFADRGMTVWFSAPSAIAMTRKRGGLLPGSMPTLRWSLFAGEALRAADVVDWHAAAHRSTVENIYGPTELTLTITGHRWSPETSPGLSVNGLVPIGTVHAGHDHLLRTQAGELSDHEGELCITGPQMTPGYLDPAHNEGRYLHHDRRTWYRTGDRVRSLPNGELIYLGRWDSQVQVGGWRVELAEIEHALGGCPGVNEAVAVARPVDGGVELVVFYTGDQVAPMLLAKQLGQILPKGMLPRLYLHRDELPLNSNRKIDRASLTAEAARLAADQR